MSEINLPTLADRAMKVYVKISVWSARKLDRKQTAKTNKSANASTEAARVNKNLLANSDGLLKEVQRKANAIRDYIDLNTLPWDDAGNRLVSNDRAMIVVGEVQNLKQQFQDAVDAFVADYPVMRAQALEFLGEMANDEDYPQPDVVRSKFNVSLSFEPLPTSFGDVRIGMSPTQSAAWQQFYEANVRGAVNGALKAAWERLRENLQRYSTRLTLDSDNKPGRFSDTMVEQLRDTLTLLHSMNVFNDPELDKLMHKVHQDIAAHDPAQLRNSPVVAQTVKNDVDDALARIKEMLG